jgi:hypothetical protein
MRTIARECLIGVATLTALVVFDVDVARAQAVGVVQLPTFQFFTVQTTVSVPDSGGAYLGGIGRSSTHSSQRGLPLLHRDPLFGGRAIGRTSAASGVSVNAQIHDLQAMDEALLRQAGGLRGDNRRIAASRVRQEPTKSLAQIRREQKVSAETVDDEADRYLEQGRQALAEGKAGVARVHLQMALRRAQGGTRNQVLSELAKLQPPTVAAGRRAAEVRPK